MAKSYKLNDGIYIDDNSIIHKDGSNNRKTLKEIINNGEMYSTTEHRVGTWIDGKPLYHKTIVKRRTNNDPTSISDIPFDYINIINPIMILNPTNANNKYFVKPYYVSSSDYARAPFITPSKNIELQASGSNTRDWIFTLEYTKTTD